MSEDVILWLSIGGVVVVAALIVALSNYLNRKSNDRRARRMQRNIANGTYDKNAKYFGDQGKWETDAYSDTTHAPPK